MGLDWFCSMDSFIFGFLPVKKTVLTYIKRVVSFDNPFLVPGRE